MTDERDEALDRLFADADRLLEGKAFVADVMARTNRLWAPGWLLVLAVVLATLPLVWIAAPPLNTALQWLTAMLSLPIAQAPEGLVPPLLAPVNSVAAVLGLLVVALRATYRRWS